MAAIASSRFCPTCRSGAEAQAADSVPFPERVSAFPSSGKGTESAACNYRVSALLIATGHIEPDAQAFSR